MIALPLNIKNGLSRLIVTSYIVTMVIVIMGTSFAIRQNWQVRLQASKSNLVRNADIGNLLIETALLSAEKTLHAAQTHIENALRQGPVSNMAMHQLLMTSLREFVTNGATDDLGLLFFADTNGQVYARSDVHLTRPIDMSDRFYFMDLRDHPQKTSTVGPLLMARTTGQWVFHMAVPIKDAKGNFSGVLGIMK